MQMYIDYLRSERVTMMDNNIRFRQIGRLENLPDAVMDEVNITLEETKNNDGLQLVLALNYGSRAEIVEAVRDIAQQVKDGRLDVRDIDEQLISDHLYTAGLPRPRPAHSHGRRAARQQLSTLADQLRRAVRQRRALAGLRHQRPALGHPRVRGTQPPIRRARPHEHAAKVVHSDMMRNAIPLFIGATLFLSPPSFMPPMRQRSPCRRRSGEGDQAAGWV
jgi:hypothetical protein